MENSRETLSISQIEQRLAQLRERYKTATRTDQKLILCRARALQNALKILQSPPPAQTPPPSTFRHEV